MKRIVAAWLLALALVAPAVAQDVNNPQTDQSQLTRNKGQLPGTTTNDCAAAGRVGEIVRSEMSLGTATVTFTSASPTVVTWTGHPYPINCSGIVSTAAINFTNSGGALPTGISTINYYAVPIDANTLHIATTVANALAGTFVNTSSAGTGTQTGKSFALLATGTAVDYGGAALTAGDWDCNGAFGIQPASTVTTINGWIGTASASALANAAYTNLALAFSSTGTIAVPLGPTQMLVASTTNIFFSGSAAFASTASGFGYFRCRRVR